MNEYFAKQALREFGVTRPSKAMIDNYIRAEEAAQREGQAPQPVAVAVRGATELTVTPPARAVPPAPPVLRPVVPPKPRSDGKKRGSSKSTLAPTLRGEGTLLKKHSKRRGRPRVIAVWMPDVAADCADGMPLKAALEKHGIHLDPTQLRALQRNSAFKEICQQARRDRRNQRQ